MENTGERIRFFRLKRGLSISDLASRAKITEDTLRDAENGKRASHMVTIRKISNALNVSPDELVITSVSSTDINPSKQVSSNPLDRSCLELAVPQIQKVFLDLGSEADSNSCFEIERQEFLLERVKQLIRHAYNLRQVSSYTELGRFIPEMLLAAQKLAKTNKNDQEQMAFGALAEANHVTASFLKKAGKYDLAWVAVDRGMHAAERSESSLFCAASTYRLANFLLDRGQLKDAEEVACNGLKMIEKSLGFATPELLSIWGGLILKLSVISAKQGDISTAWQYIGEAKATARRLKEDRNDFWTAFGPTNVAIHEVSIAMELEEYSKALSYSESVNLEILPSTLLERRAHFLIDMARCFANKRQDYDAVYALIKAEKIAPENVKYNQHMPNLLSSLISRERKGYSQGLRELANRLGVER